MTLDGSWVPEDETERRMMEDIHIATRRANADGVPRHRIASCLAFMASAGMVDLDRDPDSESYDRSTLRERLDDRETDDGPVPEKCPVCGDVVTEYHLGMGGNVVLGCGHTFGSEVEWTAEVVGAETEGGDEE